jgi:hypothetical protein
MSLAEVGYPGCLGCLRTPPAGQGVHEAPVARDQAAIGNVISHSNWRPSRPSDEPGRGGAARFRPPPEAHDRGEIAVPDRAVPVRAVDAGAGPRACAQGRRLAGCNHGCLIVCQTRPPQRDLAREGRPAERMGLDGWQAADCDRPGSATARKLGHGAVRRMEQPCPGTAPGPLCVRFSRHDSTPISICRAAWRNRSGSAVSTPPSVSVRPRLIATTRAAGRPRSASAGRFRRAGRRLP